MKFSRYNVSQISQILVMSESPIHSLGDEGIRTPDPLLARQVLSQLSYTPVGYLFSFVFLKRMGLRRLELPTSRLSGVRSNRLSYKPIRCKRFTSLKFDPAATYSPTPSPVQYLRPEKA